MASYREYFERVAYKPRYLIGDRVKGVYNKIPFVGTVGNDTVISLEEGPRVSVHLDLPIKLTDSVKSVIIVKHKDIKPLT
jgi:hypothetical protein